MPKKVYTRNRSRARNRKNLRKKTAILFVGVLVIAALCIYFFMKLPNTSDNQNISNGFSVSTTSTSTGGSAVKSTDVAATTTTTSAMSVSLENASKPLWIAVSIQNQNVKIYDAEHRVVQSFVCSTGLEGSDTPVGTYTVKEKGESFFSQTFQQGAYYWTQFDGDFLFHSVPFNKDRTIDAVEAAKLGTKASHGCVRLSIEHAKWIYDHIPRGTKVVIE